MPRLRVRHTVYELNARDHQGIGCHAVNLHVMQRWQYRFAGAGRIKEMGHTALLPCSRSGAWWELPITCRANPMATYKTRMPDGSPFELSDTDLTKFAFDIGLDVIAPSRYTSLFVFKFYLFVEFEGIEPDFILEEIKALEGLSNSAPATKPPTKFTREPLKGLWHQHFFASRFAEKNIAAHMIPKRVSETVDRICNPSEPIITPKMLDELAAALTTQAFLEREGNCKLTGEWIVFAEHGGKKYYLTLAPHSLGKEGDQRLFDEIKERGYTKFPFLAEP
jgi:hypothetical protein